MKKLCYAIRIPVLLLFIIYSLPISAIDHLQKPIPHPHLNNATQLILEGKMVPYGMFSIFLMILGALDFFEKGDYGDLVVNLNSPPYLEPLVGPNWWDYYFEPLEIAPPKNLQYKYTFALEEAHFFAWDALLRMDRKRAYQLIQNYVRVKPVILNELEDFIQKNFSDSYVIGVHYRGTDKDTEVDMIPYEAIKEVIHEIINDIPLEKQNDYKLFIATDEQRFLDYIKQSFSCPVIYTKSFRTSNGKAVHTSSGYSNYLKGKEALVDCLLLSRCDYLIRTESNLSKTSEHFNPSLPVRFMKTKWKVITN